MPSQLKIEIPHNVDLILNELECAEFQAFIVGGCVRDSIMGREPNDWDICTNATPAQMKTVFRNYNVIDTGLKHGTLTVVVDNVGYEITTYRVDGLYLDNRRPESVSFTSSLEEDLSRRDFTINSMAYNEHIGLVDPFGGLPDIQNKVIRCVGEPEHRFKEDALRIMRALRFGCTLGFEIDSSTSAAIEKLSHLLNFISKERICSEISKMIASDKFTHYLDKYRDVFFQIIPQLKPMSGFNQNNPYHQHDVFTHTLKVIDNCVKDPVLILAALLHDSGKPVCYQEGEDGYTHFHGHAKHSAMIATEVLSNLRFDNETAFQVVELIHYHDSTFTCTKAAVKRWLNKLSEMQLSRLLMLREADIKGQKDDYDQNRIDDLKEITKLIDEILTYEEPFSVGHLAIDGNSIISLGYKPGPIIGMKLRQLLECVIEGTLDNTEEALIQRLKEWKLHEQEA